MKYIEDERQEKREPLPSTQMAPSLDEKFARKGRREGEAGRDGASPLFFFLPMVHCASTRVYRVSRSPLCEYEATEQGEAEETLHFK